MCHQVSAAFIEQLAVTTGRYAYLTFHQYTTASTITLRKQVLAKKSMEGLECIVARRKKRRDRSRPHGA
jgi:hypothetical protein